MAKTSGYSQLVCDRCSKTLYATENAPEAQSWRSVKRYTADGTEVSRLLCPDCYDRKYTRCTRCGRLISLDEC